MHFQCVRSAARPVQAVCLVTQVTQLSSMWHADQKVQVVEGYAGAKGAEAVNMDQGQLQWRWSQEPCQNVHMSGLLTACDVQIEQCMALRVQCQKHR